MNQSRKPNLLRNAILALVFSLVGVKTYAQTPITWESQTNVTVASTTVTKTGGSNGSPDAGALSQQEITSAGGTFSFEISTTTGLYVVGLSTHTATNSLTSMTHAFQLSGASWSSRELGVYQTEGTFVVGDVFSIEVSSSGNVVYKKNGSTVDTSSVSATLPTKLDLQINTSSAGITNATYTAPTGPPEGTVWTICASGCDFTNSQLQTAINTMTAGVTLLLEEGYEYVGDFTLPVKAGVSNSAWVTIRTGVSSTGVVQAVTRYPADGVRVCPSTYSVDDMTCAGLPGAQDMTRYAKIKPATNNAYAIVTANTGTGTPVSYYAFRWVEFKAQSYGGNSIIGLQNATAPVETGTTAMIPHHFKFDQIVLRGDPIVGQFRGMQLDANYVEITNSFMYDIKAISEGQVLWGNTSIGGYTITNNYLSGGTEVWLTGGGGTIIKPQYTVQAGATTTSVPLDRVTDLYVGKSMAFRVNPQSISSTSAANPTVVTTPVAHGLTTGWQVIITGATCTGGTINASGSTGGWPSLAVTVTSATTFTVAANCTGGGGSGGTFYVRAQAEITAINSNTVTVTPALPFAPVAGVLADTSIVIGQGAPNVFRYNWMTRPASYRTDNIQDPPTSPSATGSITGGTLAAGTYYYSVIAQRLTAQGIYANSSATAEVSGTVASGTTGSVTISWTAVANAARYIVYGRATGAPTTSWTVTGSTTYLDNGTAGTTVSSIPSATKWQVKNTFEFKQGIDITAEFNLIEHSWQAGQNGPCVVLTTTQQTNQAPSAVIRNLMFRKNIVRRCAQFVQLVGTDAQGSESAWAGDVTFEDNLWYDGGSPYGATNGVILTDGGGQRQYPNRSPFDTVFRRNTMHSSGNSYQRAFYLDLCDTATSTSLESPANGFVMVDNIFYSGSNFATVASTGTTNPNCNSGTINRRLGESPAGPLGAGSSVTNNVFAGDTNCAGYPANVLNLSCPSVATLEADTFTDTTTFTGFKVKATSPYFTSSSTGGPIGVNIDIVSPDVTNITMTGDNSSGIPVPVEITTTALVNGFIGQVYSQTLVATGGTAPYTWTKTSGALPAGITFSTAGVLSGTPVASVTNRSLTFQVTDATAATDSQTLLLTIAPCSSRSNRYNWSWGGFFVQEAKPGVTSANCGDQPRTGDIWYRPSTSTHYKLTVSGSTVTETPLASEGGTPTTGAGAVQLVTFWAGTAQTGTPLASPTTAANELSGQRLARVKVDVENSTSCAVTATVVDHSTVAGNTLKLQWWDGSTWQDAGCAVSTDTVGPVVMEGTFTTLAAGARTQNRIFRLLHSTGNGVDTVSVAAAQVRFR